MSPSPIWTQGDEARALLADCAANPPRQRFVRGIFGPNDGEMQFDDERVKRLNAIHRRESDRLFLQMTTVGSAAFTEHCRLSVQKAIADAIAKPALECAA